MVDVALIGGAGFIGSNLARFLMSREGYRVNSFDLNDDKLRLSFENEDYSFERLDIRMPQNSIASSPKPMWSSILPRMSDRACSCSSLSKSSTLISFQALPSLSPA